jgi:hypothetical protein
MGSVEPGREDAESRLYDVAERQAGYFAASQAREAATATLRRVITTRPVTG